MVITLLANQDLTPMLSTPGLGISPEFCLSVLGTESLLKILEYEQMEAGFSWCLILQRKREESVNYNFMQTVGAVLPLIPSVNAHALYGEAPYNVD